MLLASPISISSCRSFAGRLFSLSFFIADILNSFLLTPGLLPSDVLI